MARTKTNTQKNTQTETPKTETKITKIKINVKFINCVISDYGNFTKGMEKELEERIANKMINGGYAVKC